MICSVISHRGGFQLHCEWVTFRIRFSFCCFESSTGFNPVGLLDSGLDRMAQWALQGRISFKDFVYVLAPARRCVRKNCFDPRTFSQPFKLCANYTQCLICKSSKQIHQLKQLDRVSLTNRFGITQFVVQNLLTIASQYCHSAGKL